MKKLLEEATADDIYLEYLWFLRNAPKLLNNQMPDLLFLVKRELGVGRIEEKLTGKLNYNYNSRCTALCGYPNVKVSIRDLSQISTAALLFQLFNYFRQNLKENVTFTLYFFIFASNFPCKIL